MTQLGHIPHEAKRLRLIAAALELQVVEFRRIKS